MDIIGYLRSKLEETKPYARMKLMLVGSQGIGKTSLLEQMRQEGTSGFRRRAPEHWTKRMGYTSRGKNQKGVTLSTVGVDIHDWVYQKKEARSQHGFGPVFFSTWDFGGQDEFYATHRYFLSRRSIYLVVWRLTDGLKGILGIQQWLVNIQSHASGSPVIIVGTHEDMIEGGEQSDTVQKLQSEVKTRFIDVADHDNSGLPRIMDSIVVSARTKHNIKNLCNLIYDVAFSIRCHGRNERLLEQKIPATFFYLEEIVSWIVQDCYQKKRPPVLNYDEYKKVTSEQLKLKYNKEFHDLELPGLREINYSSELHQATRFLHENGVLLHYEDSNLRDLYFLDPQWLCDILSHVVTIREINPHVKNGLMKVDDLGSLFRSLDADLSVGVQHYVVNLLNKFEVALTWNSNYLLIPSLLPSGPELLGEQRDAHVKLAPRMRGRSVARRQELKRAQASRSQSIDPIKRAAAQQQQIGRENMLRNFYEFENKPDESISRIILLRYLPAGYLARLQSAILSDTALDDACEDLQLKLTQSVIDEANEGDEFAKSLGGRPGWLCWKGGIRLKLQQESTINTNVEEGLLNSPEIFTIQELSSSAREILLNKIDFKIECSQVAEHDDHASPDDKEPVIKTQWVDFNMNEYSNIITITFPNPKLKVTSKEDRSVRYFEFDHLTMTKLLSRVVDHIDDLLEDWYPSLGTRFARTLGGSYLVTRVALCQRCSNMQLMHQVLNTSVPATINGRARASRTSERAQRSLAAARGRNNHSSAPNQIADNIIYCYYIEQCILNTYESEPETKRNITRLIMNLGLTKRTNPPKVRNLQCPLHGAIPVTKLAPDILFDDVPDVFKINNDQIERGKLIGRGALGFVYKGTLHSAFPLDQLGQSNQEVALKLLQPVDPGPDADQADRTAYKSAKAIWSREPFQCACKSYCTARHEVNILQTISHPNIVGFVGICLRPLAIILELAPLGSLADVFKNYERSCTPIDTFTVQKSILQVARALEFLHQHRVIYRDLKTENVLVWSFPSPFATKHQTAQVELKLADYGISRQALSTGIWKGFAGTMSYLAPEILRHNGDEEYTEKVDCFSFGMFMYVLLTLRPPYELNEKACGVKVSRNQFLNDSGRPTIQKKDLIYPKYMFDLMNICWSQEPHDRPTASQIVSIASTPEFIQLHDVIEFQDTNDSSQVSFSAAVEQESSTELWYGQNVINILSTNQDRWAHCEQFKLEHSARSISCMCLVEDNIWFCDQSGCIYLYLAKPRKSPQDDGADNSLDSLEHTDITQDVDISSFPLYDRRGRQIKLGPVRSMLYVERAKCVVFLTCAGLLWICELATMVCEHLKDSAAKYNCFAISPFEVTHSLSPISPLPNGSSHGDESQESSLDGGSSPSFQLFCGQSNGISCLEICEGEVRRQRILPLAGRGSQPLQEESLDDTLTSAEITQIVVAADKSELLWTAANCTVHLWSLKSRHVIRKLDCWKLVPCSESLKSINIEQYYQEAKTSQITSLVYLKEQLFLGTSHGCLIVIEASTLEPTTVFKPFESQATILRPIATNQKLYRVASAELTEVSHRLVAVGQGYRDLMQRYLVGSGPNSKDNRQENSASSNKLAAILLTTVSQYNL